MTNDPTEALIRAVPMSDEDYAEMFAQAKYVTGYVMMPGTEVTTDPDGVPDAVAPRALLNLDVAGNRIVATFPIHVWMDFASDVKRLTDHFIEKFPDRQWGE